MKSQFLRKTIVSFVFAITLINVNNARADVAPPEPPSGTNPMPGEELTNVRMVAETVLIDIDGDSPYDDGLATVTATFTMRNLGNVDEQMDVRFPLDQTINWGGLCSDIPYFSPITDLKVKVNGQSISSQKTYQTITIPTGDEPEPTVTIPCWEHFPVSFPTGKDVIIQVIYTTEPYQDADASYAYAYVLETGIGWKDTIGTADIILQVPYELNDSNFYSCWPEDCVLNGNKIQWHYEDFEPTSNIGISLLPPPLWQRVGLERKNTTENPNDGEAWGRLAKAYKESIMERRGFRSEPAAIERYQLSKEAYEKAVTLLPNDADWHYGFAELLCWNADWNNLIGESNEAMWRECVEQIRQTININPEHEKANELLEDVASLGMIDIGSSQPDFLILTPDPTATATPVEATLPAQDVIQPTTTLLPDTQVTKTTALIATGMPASTVTAIAIPISESSNLPLYLGAAALILILVFGILKRRKG
jgi:tetratricopeptide (TPR) repeat protein